MRGASPNRMIDKVPLNPCHDQIGKSVYLRFGEFTAFGQMMPFFDASAAACGGSMLSGEYRMAAPWRLPAVVLRFGCTYAVSQHFSRMTIDGRLAFGAGIGSVFVGQSEFGAELRMRQPFQHRGNPLLLVIVVTSIRHLHAHTFHSSRAHRMVAHALAPSDEGAPSKAR